MNRYKKYFASALAAVFVSAGAEADTSTVAVQEQEKSTGIAGVVRRTVPAHRAGGAHVHVQLLDGRGNVVATRMAGLPPTAPKKDVSRNYRAAYSAFFKDAELGQASKIRVLYVNHPHGECGKA